MFASKHKTASTNRFELLGAVVPDHPNSPTATDSTHPHSEVIEESSAAPAEDNTVSVDEELQSVNDGVTATSLRRHTSQAPLPGLGHSSLNALAPQEQHDALTSSVDTRRRRTFLAAPLQIVRSQARRSESLTLVQTFIDRVFPLDAEETVQVDRNIPAIVYLVTHKVSDFDFKTWHKLLELFTFAREVERVLEDVEEFDKMDRSLWLPQAGTEAEELLHECVKHFNLGAHYDINKPWESVWGRIAPLPQASR